MESLKPCIVLVLWAMSCASAFASTQEPKVVIVAQNEGTEITDLLVPYAILSKAGVQVTIVAPEPGEVELWPALTLTGIGSMNDVDLNEVDLIVVPAVINSDDQALHTWIREASSGGRQVASICDGVMVLAAAGLLEGRHATGHFYSLDDRRKRFPNITWVSDVRYVEDPPFLTTAGVSASAPASIFLAKRLVGAETAEEVATYYGVISAEAHDSTEFGFGLSDGLTMLKNGFIGLSPRKYTIVGDHLIDEFALAFTVDILNRTSRVKMLVSGHGNTATTAHGLTIKVNNPGTSNWSVLLPGRKDKPSLIAPSRVLEVSSPADTIPQLLAHVSARFGSGSARFIAKQLELPVREWQAPKDQ